MKKILSVVILSGVFLTAGVSAGRAQGPMEKFADKNIDKVENKCMPELETYCQSVIPGEGRGVACLAAHSDKLSNSCLTALYEAQGEFKNATDNVNAFAENCRADILQLCSKVAIGEGRILACLEQNKEKIAVKCRESLKSAHGDLGRAKQIGS
jgi:hypothetical protein